MHDGEKIRNVQSVNDTRNPTEDGKEDVDTEVTAHSC